MQRCTRLDGILQPHELYVQIAGSAALIAFYKTDTDIVQATVSRNWGMFMDSILIQVNHLVDFRFFPRVDNSIEPFHWSDDLDKIYFENVGKDAVFEGTEEEIKLKSNNMTAVESSSYIGEGLFSPDCVNGKGASLIDLIQRYSEEKSKEEALAD